MDFLHSLFSSITFEIFADILSSLASLVIAISALYALDNWKKKKNIT